LFIIIVVYSSSKSWYKSY